MELLYSDALNMDNVSDEYVGVEIVSADMSVISLSHDKTRKKCILFTTKTLSYNTTHFYTLHSSSISPDNSNDE